MATKEKQRKRIIDKVKHLNEEKLADLELFLNDLDQRTPSDHSTLSYSGVFKDLHMEDLTEKLHANRQSGSDRIPQF